MRSDNYNRRRRRERRQNFGSSLFRLIVILLIPVYIVLLLRDIRNEQADNDTQRTEEVTPAPSSGPIDNTPPDTGTLGSYTPSGGTYASYEDLAENDIYTFLQGPVAWNSKVPFSGAWCEEVLGGQKFSVFGCGLCCIANIYSTLTPFECSPVDMFYYARDMTEYSPSANYGAIAWEYMQQTLQLTGIHSSLMKKDPAYEEFRQNVANGITAIALVNSGDDSTYWKNVTGHYVNIWLYNSSDDTVLLADSGNPYHNRQRIPLRYVYDALKTSDAIQYLLVDSVDLAANQWQHNGIGIEWTVP